MSDKKRSNGTFAELTFPETYDTVEALINKMTARLIVYARARRIPVCRVAFFIRLLTMYQHTRANTLKPQYNIPLQSPNR